MWKKQEWIYLAHDRDKLYNTCICLKGLRKTKNISHGQLASQLRFKLGIYQIQVPGSIGSETGIYEVLCSFFSAPLQNSGLESQISS